jgi:hypothetical protein
MKMCVSSHAPNKKRQIRVMFAGHWRVLGSQYGTATCHRFGAYNLQVASKFLENLRNPHVFEHFLSSAIPLRGCQMSQTAPSNKDPSVNVPWESTGVLRFTRKR